MAIIIVMCFIFLVIENISLITKIMEIYKIIKSLVCAGGSAGCRFAICIILKI